VRKLKKFKRYAEGGALGAGEGDPFSYTDFSNRERNLRKPSEAAPIEDRKPPEPPREERLTQPEPAKAGTERVQKPAVTTTDTAPKDRGETDFNYEPQRPYNQALEDAKEQGRRARDAFKPAASSAPKPAAKPPKEDTSYRDLENARADRTKPSAPAKPSGSVSAPAKTKSAGPEDIPGTDVKTPYKGEKIDNSNLPAKQFAQSMLGATAVGRVVSPAIRGAAMVGRMFESAPKAEGKGTGKFPEEKPEINVPRTPAVVRAKPKEPAPAKEQTPAEKMGLRETRPMRDAREAKEKFEAAGKGAKDAADQASKKASDEVAAEAAKRAASKRQTPDNRRFPNKGSATSGRPKASGEVKATSNKFDRPVGEKRGPKTDEVLEREGLPIKKGGKIPAFKKGGLVGRGDGCAMRGKTKGRMV